MASRLFTFVMAAIVVASVSACGASPNAPAPTPIPICKEPQALNYNKPGACAYPTQPPGLPDMTFALPPSTERGEIRVLGPVGTSIKWTATGPTGWAVWITTCFVGPDPGPDGKKCTGGGRGAVFADLGTTTLPIPDTAGGIPVTAVHFLVWVAQGNSWVGFQPARAPDAVIKVEVPR